VHPLAGTPVVADEIFNLPIVQRFQHLDKFIE
jgi:hypothetical protein